MILFFEISHLYERKDILLGIKLRLNSAQLMKFRIRKTENKKLFHAVIRIIDRDAGINRTEHFL